MQFSDLYGAQLDIELGSADRTQLFTTARRQKAVNDAMHNFERTTSCTPRYGTINVVNGTAEYNLLTNFTDYISLLDREEPSIKRVDASGNITYIQGENFQRRTPHWLDADSPGWLADPKGTPSSWYIREDAGATLLGLDPAPSPGTETWTIRVPYLASSTDMVADADKPFTDNAVPFLRLVPYQQALVHYAAALLEPLRKGYTAAQRQMGLYSGYVAQYEIKKRRDGSNQITMRRSYFRDAARPSRPVDPHRFP